MPPHRTRHGSAGRAPRSADPVRSGQRNAAAFAGYLAQWVDVGYQRPGLVKELVARFSGAARARLPLPDYLYLRMAEGMVAMAEESKEEALRHFDFVLSLAAETDDQNSWPSRTSGRAAVSA